MLTRLGGLWKNAAFQSNQHQRDSHPHPQTNLMKNILSWSFAGSYSRGVLAAAVLCLFVGLTTECRAGGPMGVNYGWVIDNSGNPYLTSTVAASMVSGKTGYLRMEFRLIGTNLTWNSKMLGYYDTVVNNARAAGLQVIGLVDNTSWPGSQASWCSNNFENTGQNGDNAFINNFGSGAVVPLVSHFYNRIGIFELWNEPNAWTTQNGTLFTGGTYIYPSNFSQLLANSYADLEYAGLKQYVTVLSGGVFGHSIGGVYSYENAGAQYIDDTYNVGINSVGSFSYTKSHWGTYPLDAVGEHIYIDQGGTTTSAELLQYMAWVQMAYTNYEGAASAKKIMVTEFGWNTQDVSTNVQTENLNTAFNAIASNFDLVSHACWFDWQDGSAGNWGVLTSGGAQKPSYPSYQYQEQFEGYWFSGTLDNNILNYYNARTQAKLGDAYDNGGTAWVHTWAAGGYTANVQDFTGYTNGTLNIQDSSYGTYQVNNAHGMWSFYLGNGGMASFGPPKNDEYTSGSGTRQDFAGHYLTWTSAGGVVEH